VQTVARYKNTGIIKSDLGNLYSYTAQTDGPYPGTFHFRREAVAASLAGMRWQRLARRIGANCDAFGCGSSNARVFIKLFEDHTPPVASDARTGNINNTAVLQSTDDIVLDTVNRNGRTLSVEIIADGV